ncbi:hypothetical protein Y1Q_0016951 [Alligator mississippiensis]|uniref:V-type proton ATPase subunit e 2 n=1 Tax=Alligator mississippiensis TaxID=8496 RepID=A0A151MPC2_ALLMI|nr:hypothetical protein Y1Q_0016951 [Alligator mississippiensis]
MTAHSFALPLILFSAFWGLVGVAAPWLVPKGPNRGTRPSGTCGSCGSDGAARSPPSLLLPDPRTLPRSCAHRDLGPRPARPHQHLTLQPGQGKKGPRVW